MLLQQMNYFTEESYRSFDQAIRLERATFLFLKHRDSERLLKLQLYISIL